MRVEVREKIPLDYLAPPGVLFGQVMDKTTAFVIGLGILGVVGGMFALRYRGKGKLSVKSPLGSLKAEGEDSPPPALVPGGVKIKDADAGRNIRAESAGSGGVDLEKVKAKGDITATSAPSEKPRPKA